MLRIRLRRMGKKKQPSYRVVVADQRAPRDGDFVEVVGHYNPRTEPNTVVFKEERVKHWLAVGAQPTETVHRLLHQQGLWDVPPRKLPSKPSKAEQQAAARAEEEARAKAEADAAAAQAAQAAEAAEAEAAETTEESSEESAE